MTALLEMVTTAPLELTLPIGFLVALGCMLALNAMQAFKSQKRLADFRLMEERKRQAKNNEHRRENIALCRKMIAEYDGDHSLASQRKAMDACPAYLALEEHLPENFIEFMHQNASAVLDPEANSEVPIGLRALKKHLSDLERKWGLDD